MKPVCVVGVSEYLREPIDVVVDIIGRKLNTPNLGIKDQLEYMPPLHRDWVVVGIVSVEDPTDPIRVHDALMECRVRKSSNMETNTIFSAYLSLFFFKSTLSSEPSNVMCTSIYVFSYVFRIQWFIIAGDLSTSVPHVYQINPSCDENRTTE